MKFQLTEHSDALVASLAALGGLLATVLYRVRVWAEWKGNIDARTQTMAETLGRIETKQDEQGTSITKLTQFLEKPNGSR